jgi:hypothetical protein
VLWEIPWKSGVFNAALIKRFRLRGPGRAALSRWLNAKILNEALSWFPTSRKSGETLRLRSGQAMGILSLLIFGEIKNKAFCAELTVVGFVVGGMRLLFE